MHKTLIGVLLICCCFSCKEENRHSDVQEWGFKGNVRTVSRNRIAMPDPDYPDSVQTQSGPATIWYFNSSGGIDSVQNSEEHAEDTAAIYVTRYRHDGEERTGWTSFTKLQQTMRIGRTTWISDSLYTEQLYDSVKHLHAETVYHLNNTHQVKSAFTKQYDSAGHTVQTEAIEYLFDPGGRKYASVLRRLPAGKPDTTIYATINKDLQDNPTMLIVTKPRSRKQMVYQYEYSYYY